MMQKNLLLAAAALALSACSGPKALEVREFKTSDKQLSCQDILLEMNEAEFFRKKAEGNRAPGFKSVVMPIGYISSYVNAGDAMKAADNRIAYLAQIYEIKRCKDMPLQMAKSSPPQQDAAAMQNQAMMQPGQPQQMYYVPANQMFYPPQGYAYMPAPGYVPGYPPQR